MTPQDFGDKVRFYRTLRGWGQDELAHRIGKSVPTISRIENGVQNLSLIEIVALSAALEVPIKDFFDGEDIIHLPPEESEILVALMRVSRRLPMPLLKQFLALAEGVEETLSPR
jgi:transcriptional regulator with XRE-family HTH domain